MYKVLIIGANFINKGAQSMLFITMDEIYKRISDAYICFGTFENEIDTSLYRFHTVYYKSQSVRIALNPKCKIAIASKEYAKNLIKWIAGKQYRKYMTPVNRFSELEKIIKEFDLIVDISGFGLGSKWGVEGSEQYLDNIRLAKKYSIPMILMPQSFGPFDYEGAKSQKVISDIKNLLSYPYKIYAREKQGYDILTREFSLGNVEKSYDLVLQNTGIDLTNIFYNDYCPCSIEIPQGDNIAVIPNVQCFRHGDKEYNFKLYEAIINELVKRNKAVYIVSHATEDRELCVQLKKPFANNKQVFLFDRDLTCLEYDNFTTQFDFIICSRFHGIVHAYRNYVPCIVLGWAIKYIELSEAVGQGQYCFDLTSVDENFQEKVIEKILYMDRHYLDEKSTIKHHLTEIQKNNCFDVIDNLIQSQGTC